MQADLKLRFCIRIGLIRTRLVEESYSMAMCVSVRPTPSRD